MSTLSFGLQKGKWRFLENKRCAGFEITKDVLKLKQYSKDYHSPRVKMMFKTRKKAHKPIKNVNGDRILLN